MFAVCRLPESWIGPNFWVARAARGARPSRIAPRTASLARCSDMSHPPWSGAALERAPETAHERGRAVDRGRGPEDVEVGSLEHDADAVLREPPSIGAVQVVNGPSRGDVRADAAERREEGGELGRETACRVGYGAEQGEAAPDDVVEPADRLAEPHLALREEMAGERVTVDQQPWTDRRGWQRRRGAPILHGGDHRGIARGGLGGVGNADHRAELDRERDRLANLRDALGRVGVEQRVA